MIPTTIRRMTAIPNLLFRASRTPGACGAWGSLTAAVFAEVALILVIGVSIKLVHASARVQQQKHNEAFLRYVNKFGVDREPVGRASPIWRPPGAST